MKGRNLTVDDCIKSLKEAGVSFFNKEIRVPKNSLGNKRWGMTDYLSGKGYRCIIIPNKAGKRVDNNKRRKRK